MNVDWSAVGIQGVVKRVRITPVFRIIKTFAPDFFINRVVNGCFEIRLRIRIFRALKGVRVSVPVGIVPSFYPIDVG